MFRSISRALRRPIMWPVSVLLLSLFADIGADIRALAKLHDDGLLTDGEFSSAKAKAVESWSPRGGGAQLSSVLVDCGDSNGKVLTAVYNHVSGPIDLTNASLCPEVIGTDGYPQKLKPVNVPDRTQHQ